MRDMHKGTPVGSARARMDPDRNYCLSRQTNSTCVGSNAAEWEDLRVARIGWGRRRGCRMHIRCQRGRSLGLSRASFGPSGPFGPSVRRGGRCCWSNRSHVHTRPPLRAPHVSAAAAVTPCFSAHTEHKTWPRHSATAPFPVIYTTILWKENRENKSTCNAFKL